MILVGVLILVILIILAQTKQLMALLGRIGLA